MAIAAASMCVVIFGGVIFAIVRFSQRQQRSREHTTERFCQEMDRLGVREPLSWRIHRGGQRYHAGVTPQSKAPPVFWLTAVIEARAHQQGTPFRATGDRVMPRLPRLRLRRERPADRLGKSLRLNREVQTGDPRFDGEVYIESDASDQEVLAVLSSPRARDAVVALLGHGVHQLALNHDGEQLRIHWQGEAPEANHRLQDIVASFDAFVCELPAFADVSLDRRWMRGTGFVTAAGLTLLVSFALLGIGFNVYQPVDTADAAPYLLLGAALWLAVTIACAIRVAGSSNALRYFGWAALIGALAFPLVALGAAVTINGAFDGALREQRVYNVSATRHTGSKSTSYRLHADPWPPHRDPIELSIGQRDYQALANPEATLRIGRGALGIEWFDGIASYR